MTREQELAFYHEVVQTAVGQCRQVGDDMAEYSFWDNGFRDYIVSEIEHYLKAGGDPEDFNAKPLHRGEAFRNSSDYALASRFDVQDALYANNKHSFDAYMTEVFYTYGYTNLPPDKKGLFIEVTCQDFIEKTHKEEGVPLYVAQCVMAGLQSDGLGKYLANALSQQQIIVPTSPVQEKAQAILNAQRDNVPKVGQQAEARPTQQHEYKHKL